MGQKVSSNPRVRTNYGGPVNHQNVAELSDPSYPTSSSGARSSVASTHPQHHLSMRSSASSSANGASNAEGHQRGSYPSIAYAVPTSSSHHQSRNRARSLGGTHSDSSRGIGAFSIPGLMDLSSGQDSDDSSPEDGGLSHPVVTRSRGMTFPFHVQSFPAQLFTSSIVQGIKCPVCSKFVPPDDVECHLVICLTKPRIVYNEDVLSVDTGECVICLDDLQQGDTIARLPCLCIYHKSCIDMWFERNRSCPEHPSD